jgi:3'-phosphoadenosine 5'-phosphosulfate sulfotransferase (PAPS reductase)/FAD synthetase
MDRVTEAIAVMEAAAKQHDAIAVGYSGGKDSLCVLDIAVKTFKKVVPVFWFTVPGISFCEAAMKYAEDRYGLKPIQIPDWRKMNAIKLGLWCDEFTDLPELDLKRACAFTMEVAGCDILAMGMKEADGTQRRQFFGNIRDSSDKVWTRLILPIRRWTIKEVRGYLAANNIPLPETSGRTTSGVGTDHDSICWLHDNHPDDFKKFCRWFPYAQAVIERRKLYGI